MKTLILFALLMICIPAAAQFGWPGVGLGDGLYNDTDTALRFTGGWTRATCNATWNCLNGDYTATTTIGALLTLTVWGDYVRVARWPEPTHAYMEVCVLGACETYAPSVQNVSVYLTGEPPHTINVYNAGGASGATQAVWVDHVEVRTTAPPEIEVSTPAPPAYRVEYDITDSAENVQTVAMDYRIDAGQLLIMIPLFIVAGVGLILLGRNLWLK